MHYWEGNKGKYFSSRVAVLAQLKGGTVQSQRAEYFPILPDQG